ncbi:MAG: hypothetical protein JXB08_00690 [Bacilli bacterium]|nr:hypothetical protein [Bacilli bacterium]MBN2876861.1 hypothetical protein [Bacilli bacterium]
MSKLIIVTGHLAALKTTISSRLGKDLGILSLNKDHIKEILGDTIGFQNRQENLKLSNATFQLIQYLAEKNLMMNHDIIIESNFKQEELSVLKSSQIIANSDILTLFLTGNPDILYQRYQERQPNRHPVHTSTGLMSFETFQSMIEEYKFDECLGETIKIDTTEFKENQYQLILNKIKEFIHT